MSMKLRELEKKRDNYASEVVKMAIQVAVTFAIPAIIAVVLYKYVNVPIVISLPLAFIVSWALVVRLYKKVDREAKELDKQIADAKAEQAADEASNKDQEENE